MSTDNPSSPSSYSAQTSTPQPDVIDLTGEVDSPPSLPPPPPRLPSVDSDLRSRLRRAPDRVETQTRDAARPRSTHNTRPPRFGRNIMAGTPELIDLSTASDEVEEAQEPAFNRRLPPPVPTLPVDASTGSSEVEFVGSRPIPQSAETANSNHQPQVPAPSTFQPFLHGMNHLRDILAASTSFINPHGRHGAPRAGTSRVTQDRNRILEEEHVQWIARAVGNQHRAHLPQRRLPDLVVPAPNLDEDFDGIIFNYAQPAFTLGGMIEAGVGSSTPDRRPSPPYKPPPAAAEGFTRKIEEDDEVVCVNCGDELGVGEGEVKRQVWVAKQCGHGYCGDCATNRSITKGATKRQQRAVSQRPNLHFKSCRAPLCNKPVSHKTAMIQIYL